MKLALCLAAVLAASCTIGAPPGFSSGDSWSIPLVGPLEDGALVVPVFINDAGPYLLKVDPDANQTILDEGIVAELRLRNGIGGRMMDETDTTKVILFAEVSTLRVGTLTVTRPVVQMTRPGTYPVGGRQLRGVLGRDILADSLVFGFDRDRGMAYLATKQGFTRPTGAVAIGYDVISNRLAVDIPPLGRRVTDVKVGSGDFDLHLDLGEARSQLRQSLWDDGGLAAVPANATLVDEVGTARQTKQAGLGSNVRLGPLTVPQVLFLPYDDRRWEEADVDGTLGLDALLGQVVWLDADDHTLYLVPRTANDLLAERLDRWNSSVLSGCAQPGCVTVTADTTPPAPTSEAPGMVAPGALPSGRPTFRVARDPSAKALPLDVLIEAVDGTGARVGAPRVVLSLPVGVDALAFQVDLPDGAAAGEVRWVVRDASPFARACRGGGGCALPL